MLELDGSRGGGQLLRTALTLSMCTGTPFRMTGIRAGRRRPGLMRQHLTAVEAARAISSATVLGASPGSVVLEFLPGEICAGNFHFPIGTAGSTTLVLQTILPALLQADAPSSIHLEGGTHNPLAPPADFLIHAFAPVLRKMGVEIEIELERYGFYPAGGGSLRVRVSPCSLQPVNLMERGALKSVTARALVSGIPSNVADRELAVVARQLGLAPDQLEHRSVRPVNGPGNALMIFIESENIAEVVTAFGERGISAESVGERACSGARDYLEKGLAVGEHPADQLLLPIALAGSGSFTTAEPGDHFRSNSLLIEKFLPVEIEFAAGSSADRTTKGLWDVRIAS